MKNTKMKVYINKNKNIKIKIISFVLAFCLLLTSFTYAKSDITVDESSELFKQTMQRILDTYKGQGEVDERILFDAAMKGMFNALDKYSEYFSEEEYNEYIKYQEGFFYGIGAVISTKDDVAEISDVYKDSPAEKAGLKSGDLILQVDGEDIKGKTASQISSVVKGDDGTVVTLKINRAGNLMEFNVTRGKIEENPITAASLDEIIEGEDSKVLYIEIDTFNKNLSENLIDTLEKYIDKGIDKVIIDLRNNTGGYFTEALRVCGIFLDKNDIVTTMIDKAGTESKYVSVSESVFDKVIVLVNNKSASASELVAAALKENDKCILIGENTYGKSVAQNIIDDEKVKYKLTMNEYLTPLGNSINGIGVEPDIKIEIPKYIYDIKNKYYGGEVSNDIITVKAILKYLGYTIGTEDNMYDDVTKEAIMKFQANSNIGSYGGIDYTTQMKLNEALSRKLSEKDIVFEKAVEVIKDYDNYVSKFVSKK